MIASSVRKTLPHAYVRTELVHVLAALGYVSEAPVESRCARLGAQYRFLPAHPQYLLFRTPDGETPEGHPAILPPHRYASDPIRISVGSVYPAHRDRISADVSHYVHRNVIGVIELDLESLLVDEHLRADRHGIVGQTVEDHEFRRLGHHPCNRIGDFIVSVPEKGKGPGRWEASVRPGV